MSSNKFCFTINQSAQNFYDGLETLFEAKDCIKYICGQLEEASTGQLHFQGYIQLVRSKKCRVTALQKITDSTGHFEIQKASCNDDARGYCMKSETQVQPFKEFGIYTKGRGSRSDLAKFKESVKDGATRKQLMNEHYKIFAQYRHFYGTLKEIYGPPKAGKDRKVSIYFGTPGTGKTRMAVAITDDEDDFWKQPIGSSKWFNGYDGQSIALLDDFAGRMNKVALLDLLRLTDRYPEYLEIKGGYTWWYPDHIIITTNYHPRAWYDWSKREPSYKALQRRITEVIEFTEEGHSEVDVDCFFNDEELWPEPHYEHNHGYT